MAGQEFTRRELCGSENVSSRAWVAQSGMKPSLPCLRLAGLISQFLLQDTGMHMALSLLSFGLTHLSWDMPYLQRKPCPTSAFYPRESCLQMTDDRCGSSILFSAVALLTAYTRPPDTPEDGPCSRQIWAGHSPEDTLSSQNLQFCCIRLSSGWAGLVSSLAPLSLLGP